MDEAMALDLAYQIREHIGYTGNSERFDQEILALIRAVEDQCALVVEQTPPHLFYLGAQPKAILSLIASAIRSDL